MTAAQTDVAGFQQWTSSLARLLETATSEIEKDRAAAKTAIAMASSLLRIERERHAGLGDRRPRGLAGWQRLRVQAYIEQNLERRIHIRDLCEIVRRSPSHFSRAFKLAFGTAPHAYIVRRRLDRATYLMLSGDASLSEIALACGFTDQAHLSNLFRQHLGESPSLWRRRRQEEGGAACFGSAAAGA